MGQHWGPPGWGWGWRGTVRLCHAAPGSPAGPGAACVAGRWPGSGPAPPWAESLQPSGHCPLQPQHRGTQPQPSAPIPPPPKKTLPCGWGAATPTPSPAPALSCPQPKTGVTGGGSGGPTRHCCPVSHCAVPSHAMPCRAGPYNGTPCRAVLCLMVASPGTTWMQEILTLLFSHGDALPAKTIPNWERAPWLEQIYFRDALQDTATHRLITTHLPARVLAPALQQSKAKVRGGAGCSWGGPRGGIPCLRDFPLLG